MVVIRLARCGQKHRPKYRVTVADSRFSAKGRFIEVLGTYNPFPQGKDEKLVLNQEKLKAWIAKGAQPTDRVKSLLKSV